MKAKIGTHVNQTFKKDTYVKRVKTNKKPGLSLLCLLVSLKKSLESTSKLKHYFILYQMSEDLLDCFTRKEKTGLPWQFSGFDFSSVGKESTYDAKERP